MKRLLAALMGILLYSSSFAQSTDIQNLIHVADSLKASAPDSFDYVLALDAVASHYYTMGEFGLALPYREQCLKAVSSLREESNDAVLLVKTYLADTYSRLERYEDAVDLYLQCAGIYAYDVSPRENYINVLNGLVVAYIALDDIPSAIQYRSQSAQLFKRLYGADSQYATQKWLLGELYALTNQHELAIYCFDESKEILESVKETNTDTYSQLLRDLLNSALFYGDELYNQGELLDARVQRVRAIEISEIMDDDITYMKALYRKSVGDIDSKLGEYASALIFYDDALNLFSEEDKEIQKEFYIQTLTQKAVCLSFLQRYTEEFPVIKEVVDLAKDKYGTYSFEYALDMDLLGQVYFYLENYDAALNCYLESRNVFSRIRHPKNVYYEFIQQDIASAYNKLGKIDQAIKENSDLIRYLQDIYGSNSLQVITRIYIAGAFYEENKDVANADKTYLKSWELIQVGGHQYTTEAAEILDVVTQIYIRNEDYDKAISLRQLRGDIVAKVYGDYSSEAAENLKLLGNVYFLKKDYSNAILSLTKSTQLYESLGFSNEPVYAQAMETLAYARLAQNDAYGSISDGIKALGVAEQKYGKLSMNYAQVLSNLGDAYYTGQMFPEALESYTESYSIVQKTNQTSDHLYEHLIQALPHAYIKVGDYDNGTSSFELYKDYLISSGKNHGQEFEYLLHDIAANSLYATDHDLAIKLNQEYLAYLDNKGQRNEDYAIALSSIAYLYSAKGDVSNTVKYADLSNALFEEMNLKDSHYIVSNATYMYAVTGDDAWVKKALELVNQLNVDSSEKNAQLRWLYNYIASADYNAGRKDCAYNHYGSLLKLDEMMFGTTSIEYVTDLYMMGIACMDTNIDESLARLLSAADILEKSAVTDNDTYPAVLFWIGLNYQNRFSYSEAISYYYKALPLTQTLDNYKLRQAILNNYGQVATKLGDFAIAVSMFENKLSLARNASGQYEDVCQSLDGLGRVHAAFGDYNKAISYYEEAREIAKSHEDDDFALSATLGIGSCYEAQRKFDEAINEIEKAKQFDAASTLNVTIPVFNLIIANEYLEIGEQQKSKILVDEIEANIASILTNDPKIDGTIYQILATYYIKVNNLSKGKLYSKYSQELLKEALGESSEEYIKSVFMSGVSGLNSGDLVQAISEIDRANSLFVSNYSANNPLSYTYSFYPLFARYSTDTDVSKALITEFVDFEKNQAKDLFFQMTGSERSSFWNTHTYSKDLVYSIGTERGYSEILYDYALFYKGILLDADIMLGRSILESGDQEAINKYTALLALKEAALNGHNSVINDMIGSALNPMDNTGTTKGDIYSVINELERDLAQFAVESLGQNLSYDTNYSDVVKALAKNDVAIEFVDYEKISKQNEEDLQERYYCALILKSGSKVPEIIPLCSQTELNKCLKGGENVYDSSNFMSGELYNLVWAPLEKSIKKGSTVYFSPSGTLYQIAIESISTPKGKPLSELYSLYRVSSTKTICKKEIEDGFSSSILYGGLQYDMEKDLMISQSREYTNRSYSNSNIITSLRGESRSGWGYLPGTKAEVETLSDLFNSNNVKCSTFTGIYGNEESFKSLSGTDASILHIATHGFYLQANDTRKVTFFEKIMSDNLNGDAIDDPMKRSGLILSGGNLAWQGNVASLEIEDGILTAEEISNLHLENTKLVVLSACESGLGDLSSDGVMGIQRAFKNAGVQTLVMSLWKVDDEATKLLMTEFYKRLLEGEHKRHAFDAAKETIRKDSRYSDPHYWAAFIMLD